MWCLASCRLRAEVLVRQLHLSIRGPSRSSSPVVQSPPARCLHDFSLVNGHCYVMFSGDDDPDNGHSPPTADDVVAPLSPDVETKDEGVQLAPGDDGFRPKTTEPNGDESERRQSDSGVASSEADGPLSSKEIVLADELCSRLLDYQLSRTDKEREEAVVVNSTERLPSEPDPGGWESRYLTTGEVPRLTRSTSLKSGKTPPGTPCRKKIVRFADALGLDLEAVRQFADDDSFTVPQSAFSDLQVPLPDPRPPWEQPASVLLSQPVEQHLTLCPQFPPPAADCRFLDRVRTQKVSLESVTVEGLTVRGVVRVLNLAFHKAVTVRYTTNEWATCDNRTAIYMQGSCDGFSDKFAFSFDLANLNLGQRVVFALQYSVNDQDYWDNNRDQNYVLRCQVDPTRSSPDTRWLHHFL